MAFVDTLKEGDVIYTSCRDFGLCHHLGIVQTKNGKKYIYHNSPEKRNKYGGSVVCETYEDFTREREVIKKVSTIAKNKEILYYASKNKYEVWDSIFFNCEDFVTEIVEGKRNSEIREVWKICALSCLLIYLI